MSSVPCIQPTCIWSFDPWYPNSSVSHIKNDPYVPQRPAGQDVSKDKWYKLNQGSYKLSEKSNILFSSIIIGNKA